jgi:ribosomal protein L15
LDELKAKKLVPAKTRRLKILAHGILSKPLTVKANSYSVQAIKMIELTGGTVVIRRVVKKK